MYLSEIVSSGCRRNDKNLNFGTLLQDGSRNLVFGENPVRSLLLRRFRECLHADFGREWFRKDAICRLAPAFQFLSAALQENPSTGTPLALGKLSRVLGSDLKSWEIFTMRA